MSCRKSILDGVIQTLKRARSSSQQTAEHKFATNNAGDNAGDKIRRALLSQPFKSPWIIRNNHVHTIVSNFWPRGRERKFLATDETRFFEVESGVQISAHCRWQERKHDSSVLILIHGLEGSAQSVYMLGTAYAAFKAGFNVVRLNLRSCGDTERLAPGLYNSGMSGDICAVVSELVSRDGFDNIFVAGFSLGGNLVFKFAGELNLLVNAGVVSNEVRSAIGGFCAISPALDLHACAEAIERPSNRIYLRRFMKSLKRRLRRKKLLYPDLYDIRNLKSVKTIRDFDERYTALQSGYKDANDYYTRASSLPLAARITKPTLIIHAQDDPFTPFDSFVDTRLTRNSNIIILTPRGGGHVGFMESLLPSEAKFWAEKKIVEFCALVRSTHNSCGI